MKRLVGVFMFLAIYNPMSVPNNKFGIHVVDEHDLEEAAALVNSSGGSWGYVTFVIRKDERDNVRWNRVLTKLTELKLIPIVRLATENNNGVWNKPLEEDAGAWAAFLGSLDWPTENRYVILFNEPNHSKEWGGELNPAEYSQIARIYWEQLKRRSDNFFVLPAAMDEAAINTDNTMGAQDFFDGMERADNLIFTLFDGWNSHSYPNPGFEGDPKDEGKMGISGYKWEVNYLEKYGLRSNIPVFITETGWINKLGQEKIYENFIYAFEKVWNDDQVVAVTPFILNYSYPPFDEFSWKNPETGDYYSYYYTMKIFLVEGEPKITLKKEKVAGAATTKTYPFLVDYIRDSTEKTSLPYFQVNLF
jgi:hypothetical protein